MVADDPADMTGHHFLMLVSDQGHALLEPVPCTLPTKSRIALDVHAWTKHWLVEWNHHDESKSQISAAVLWNKHSQYFINLNYNYFSFTGQQSGNGAFTSAPPVRLRPFPHSLIVELTANGPFWMVATGDDTKHTSDWRLQTGPGLPYSRSPWVVKASHGQGQVSVEKSSLFLKGERCKVPQWREQLCSSM